MTGVYSSWMERVLRTLVDDRCWPVNCRLRSRRAGQAGCNPFCGVELRGLLTTDKRLTRQFGWIYFGRLKNVSWTSSWTVLLRFEGKNAGITRLLCWNWFVTCKLTKLVIAGEVRLKPNEIKCPMWPAIMQLRSQLTWARETEFLNWKVVWRCLKWWLEWYFRMIF